MSKEHYYNLLEFSWHIILKYNIKELPVKVSSIAKQAGIKLYKNSKVMLLKDNEAGICFFDHKNNSWCIVYDDTMNIGRIRFTIAHELYHVLKGMDKTKVYSRSKINIDKPQEEVDADMFAIRLLAPARILHELGLYTAEEISKVCNISIEAAGYRAKRLIELERRKKFDTLSDEYKVFLQFKPWLESLK